MGKPSGASEPDSMTSELADTPVSESLHSLHECPCLAAGLPRTEDGWLIAEGAKLVPSSATGKALDARRWSLDSLPLFALDND